MQLRITEVPKTVLRRTREIREDLHRHPELSYREERTAELVADSLRDLGLDEVRTHVARTGVVGLLRGREEGPTVALRAEMDALPMTEETGLPYASENDGAMHACGHDGHTAILLAVARLLAERRDELPGNVKFIFQPAEENLAGGALMVEEGCLRDPRPAAIFALHGAPGTGVGQIRVAATPSVGMANFRIDIQGKGGHGAVPHQAVDPVIIGAHIVTAAQTIVSREIRPDHPVVISFCTFQAGTTCNIIPDTAKLLGTTRATQMETLNRMRRSLDRVAKGIAESMRGEARLAEEETYPPVHNDPALLDLVRQVGAELLGPQNVLESEGQGMTSEDFSFYLEDQGGVPGVIFGLGVGTNVGLHNPHFDFGSEALEPGILLMCNIALQFLQRNEMTNDR